MYALRVWKDQLFLPSALFIAFDYDFDFPLM